MRKLLLLVLALSATSLFGANLLSNSGFETQVPPVGIATVANYSNGNSTGIPSWTVTGTTCTTDCVSIVGTNYTETTGAGTLTFLAQGGNYSLDLTGSSNSLNGGIQQTVTLSPGTNYLLTFWLGHQNNTFAGYAGPATADLYINGSNVASFSNNSNACGNCLTWLQQSLAFTASTASNTIKFQNTAPVTQNHVGLDTVNLDINPVPEPATFGMLGIALCALGVVRRFRRQ